MKTPFLLACCYLGLSCLGFTQITIQYPPIIQANAALQGTFTDEEKAVIAKAVEHWQAAFPCVMLELSFRGVKFMDSANQQILLGAATVTEDSMGPVATSGGSTYGDIPTTGTAYSGIPKKATIMLRRLKMNEPERFFISEDPGCPFAHNEWIPRGKADFYSTVIHEIGHAMGLDSNSTKLMNMLDTTTTPHSIPCPPGDPAYMTADKAHLAEEHHADDVMRPGGARLGKRFFISELDQQLLKKIYGPTYKRGFEIELPPGATPPSTVNIIVRRAANSPEIKDIHFPAGSLPAGATVTLTTALTSATGTPPQNWTVFVDEDFVSLESDTALSMGEFKFTITLPNGKVFSRKATNEVIFTEDGSTLEDPVGALGDFPAIVDASYVPGPGQPSDWDALLEVNDSVDAGGIPLQDGVPGPYFAAASPGDAVFISMFGQKSMPLALLYGPLNPGAATFPGVGQMDIGGTVNPSTGIPGSIQVLGNGIMPMTFLDLFFHTDPSGFCLFCFDLSPVFPPGFTTTFQVAFLKDAAPYFELSNAVQLVVN